MAQTASDLLLERLIDWGVDTVFGLPGDGINGFMEALRKRADEVRFVHTRHEETAALAAVGYAKFTGRLGVCLSTAAPGAVHLLNGLRRRRRPGAGARDHRHDLPRPDRHALPAGHQPRLPLRARLRLQPAHHGLG